MERPRFRRWLISIGLIIVGMTAVFVGLYFTNYYLHLVPVGLNKFLYAGIVAISIFAIIRIVVVALERYFSKYASTAKVRPFVFVISLIGYFVLALAVFAVLGFDISSIVLGSTFISLILGLAAQNVLSNVFAGLMIILARPFADGDFITLNTWQYGAILPSYPPKYFSRDNIRPGYIGRVSKTDLLYTSIKDEMGQIVKIPNSIVIQAAVQKIGSEGIVRTRYEIPKEIEFRLVEELLRKKISELQDAKSVPKILIDESTQATYIITVDVNFRTEDPDSKKSEVLQVIMNAVEPLKKKIQSPE